MAAQVDVAASPPIHESAAPTINVPAGYHISSQDGRLGDLPVPSTQPYPPPLGVLKNFTGCFVGTGLNLIFRPNSGETKFKNPLDPNLPDPPHPPSQNVLELNLTSESLCFSYPLGEVPNRGLEKQNDIKLNGVPYVQAVSDVTNCETGEGDAPAKPIHFEPGLWMHVPETQFDPVLAESLTRMASIPHGTTINAQGLAPTKSHPGPPLFTGPQAIPGVDITPFVIGNPGPSGRIRFASQNASATNVPRLPQDLTKFIAAGTITQPILDNPNIVLANAIEGQNITKTIVFVVSTTPKAPFLAGGTANIDFLQGSSVGIQSGPNASAAEMSATFWIEEVQHSIEVPVFKHGEAPLLIQVPPANPGAQAGPTFRVHPPHEIKSPKTISVTFTQIQYMQTVFLNFSGLTWPHVSCATLVPDEPLDVPATAFE